MLWPLWRGTDTCLHYLRAWVRRGGKVIFPLHFWVLSWDPHNKRQINKGKKPTEVYKNVLMKTPRGKWVSQRSDFDFRINTFLVEKSEGAYVQGEQTILREDGWALTGRDEKEDSLWQSSSGYDIHLYSPLPWWVRPLRLSALPRKKSGTTGLFSEGLSLGR